MDWTDHLAGERVLAPAGRPRKRDLLQYLSVESIKEVGKIHRRSGEGRVHCGDCVYCKIIPCLHVGPRRRAHKWRSFRQSSTYLG